MQLECAMGSQTEFFGENDASILILTRSSAAKGTDSYHFGGRGEGIKNSKGKESIVFD